MFKVKLEDIDRMENLIDELGILTYLRNLVLADSEGNIRAPGELKEVRVNSAYYLLNLQEEAVSNLRELLRSKDFTTKS